MALAVSVIPIDTKQQGACSSLKANVHINRSQMMISDKRYAKIDVKCFRKRTTWTFAIEMAQILTGFKSPIVHCQ